MFYSSTNTATNNTPSITLTLIRITAAAAAAVINGTEDGPGDTHDDDD